MPLVHMSSGVHPEERRSFQPKAALADYDEIPGVGTELVVTLSSHPMACDAHLPLAKDQILVTLTFSAPPSAKLGPGAYPWPGLQPAPAQNDSPSVADAGTATDPPTAQVMPYIRFGDVGQLLPPGGLVELTEVRLDAQGGVKGLLRLEQPGAAGLPATSLLGSFSARWCRISLAGANDAS